MAIANGQSLSGAVNLPGPVTAIAIPTLTTDSSSITFQGSADGVTYQELNTADGTAYVVVTAATGATTVLLATVAASTETLPFIALPYIKVRTGLVGAAQAQGAARTITLVCQVA